MNTALDSLTQDLRLAARGMLQSPGFSAAAILTLALCIGATTAVFSVIDATLLRSLPYHDPDRLYVVHELLPQLKVPVVPVNATHFREWRTAARSFEDMALLFGSEVNVTGPGDPERLHSARVSPSLFPMLGVRAQLGRTFFEEEDQPGRDLVVVLSHELWSRRFAADPRIIGRTIALDGEAHTIIGVLPRRFALPKLKHLYERPNVAERPQLWKPFALWNDEPILAQMYSFACIARVKPDVSASQAVADLNTVQANLARQARQKSQFQATLVPLHDQIFSRSRNGLQLMLAAVAMVLIVGCVNIAHLMLARGSARRREMAVRLAIGATRGRLVWQMLSESVLVATAGGLAGVVVAYSGVRLIRTFAVVDVPRLDDAALNGRVLLFTVVTSIVAGVLSGFLPAWQGAKTDALESMRSASSAVARSKSSRYLRWLLVSLEVGVSTICLIAAGLLLHSFVNVLGIDRGFSEERAVSVQLNLTHGRYREAAGRIGFVDTFLERARSVGGVVSAGIASRLPLSGQAGGSVLTVDGTNLPRLERAGARPAVWRQPDGLVDDVGRDWTTRHRGCGRSLLSCSTRLAGRAAGGAPRRIGDYVGGTSVPPYVPAHQSGSGSRSGDADGRRGTPAPAAGASRPVSV